ncbi:MAG: putative PP-loop ATPase [Haloquadratum sp. J07HQX50]|nr:MAG: putative PP-loop ATPase [Haloquadratum sp. J07HQX50]
MEVALLYSGGKDSTLAALLLDSFYDVRLVTATFGLTDDWKYASAAAAQVGYPFKQIQLDRAVAETAVEKILADGYPRQGIQTVHEHTLEVVAQRDIAAVADGTRRDDRVPTVPRARAQSIEDRHDVDYVSPLAGFGRGAIDHLVDQRLDVEVGPSETVPKSDYEVELRTLIAELENPEVVSRVFPDHEQTYVRGILK